MPKHTLMSTGPQNSEIIADLSRKSVQIEAWFRNEWHQTPPPFYGSVDIRNAGFKIAPVDNNLFPGGFNNLDLNKMPFYVQAIQATIAEICPCVTRLLLIPESHTRNLFYLENVGVLHHILLQAGFDIRLGSLDAAMVEPVKHMLPSGKELLIEPITRHDNQISVSDFTPCLIILNNDLSDGIPRILQNLTQRIIPALELGWATRHKSSHFLAYDEVCQSFAKQIDIDPWLIMPYFAKCTGVDFKNPNGQTCLVEQAQQLFHKIEQKYQEYKINYKPFLVIKADQGTYGMAVMMIDHPEQLLKLNRKDRNKMTFIKGGREVTEVIIQEGVHTFETIGSENSVTEPVIYLIGRHVIGGFYRVHKERGPRENLNSPGMNFEPLAIEHPCHLANEECEDKRYYVYGIIARLAQLAAARELTLNRSA